MTRTDMHGRTHPSALHVLLVGELRATIEALRLALDAQSTMHCVGIAATLEDARVIAGREERVDVALVDWDLPDPDAFVRGLTRDVARVIPMVPTSISEQELRRASQSGAATFALRDAPLRALLDSLGGPTPQPVQADTGSGADASSIFTPRELDVLRCLADGLSVRGCARRLAISDHTVRGHTKQIYSKLGVHSQLEAVLEAARRGYVDLPSTAMIG